MKTNSDKKLIKPITINGIKFKSNIFQAPMAGITNYAFRELCKKYKVGLLCSEMISDLGVFHNNEKTIKMIEFSKKQRPISIQLFGNDVKEMTNAALYIEKNFKPDLIDINFGCPAYKVANSKQAGSYLLKTPNKIYEIVKSIKDSIKTPVSAKIRSGWDEKHINAIEVAKLIEKAGASFITIHPRTKIQEFTGQADWNIIKHVKESVNIPVIGNGDIKQYSDVLKMLNQTGCDGVMIGRGSIGNPWIFNNKKPTIKLRKKTIIQHLKLLRKTDGEKKAVMLIKPHIKQYLHDIKNRKEFTQKIMFCKEYKEVIKIIKSII